MAGTAIARQRTPSGVTVQEIPHFTEPTLSLKLPASVVRGIGYNLRDYRAVLEFNMSAFNQACDRAWGTGQMGMTDGNNSGGNINTETGAPAGQGSTGTRKKRRLSAEARAKMRAAQQKRWAAIKATGETTSGKRGTKKPKAAAANAATT